MDKTLAGAVLAVCLIGAGLGQDRPMQTESPAWVQGAGPSFVIKATPAEITVPQGCSGVCAITATRLGGFDAPITLGVGGLPDGVMAVIDRVTTLTLDSGVSTIIIPVSATVTPGNYSLTVTGTGGGLTSTAKIVLHVATVVPPEPSSPTISHQDATLHNRDGDSPSGCPSAPNFASITITAMFMNNAGQMVPITTLRGATGTDPSVTINSFPGLAISLADSPTLSVHITNQAEQDIVGLAIMYRTVGGVNSEETFISPQHNLDGSAFLPRGTTRFVRGAVPDPSRRGTSATVLIDGVMFADGSVAGANLWGIDRHLKLRDEIRLGQPYHTVIPQTALGDGASPEWVPMFEGAYKTTTTGTLRLRASFDNKGVAASAPSRQQATAPAPTQTDVCSQACRDQLNKGVQAFKDAQYGEAVEYLGEWDYALNPLLHRAFEMYMARR